MRANLGWNTWDVAHVNGVVHLESGIRLRFILIDKETGERKDQFNWQQDLAFLGPHSGRALGYARIDVRWKAAVVSMEYAAQADRLGCRLELSGAPGLEVSAVVDAVWGTRLRVAQGAAGLRLHAGGDTWILVNAGEPPVQGDEKELRFDFSGPVLLEIRKEGSPVSGSITEVLAEQWAEGEQAQLKSAGWLEDGAEGLTRSIHWNTIWEAVRGRVCTPVSREWCNNPDWGGYVLFDWDTFFCALMAAAQSPELFRENARAILQEITPRGFVPNYGSGRGSSTDRSQPPVGAYCILKAWRGLRLAEGGERRRFLEETFDALLGWHQWWPVHRDGNQDGLLEWGSDPVAGEVRDEAHTLRAAMFESGLDNSPMYDETIFNPTTHTMELSDVGLNALYALDAWALSEIAAEIGREEEARALHEEYIDCAERINRELWNEEAGIYLNRGWDGVFSAHLSPTLFYPLLAGIVPPERAERMVREHLLNEKEFWGEYSLPSISRSDPGYRQGERVRDGVSSAMSAYWRGRIWGPMNFLVSEGLHRYGFDGESYALARKSTRLFLREWAEENHVHENYDDLSGEGDDVPSSNALYHWGSLLVYQGIQELADCEAWDGWRFGNLGDDAAEIKAIQLEEGRLDVRCGAEGLKIELDRRLLLESDRPVIVRGYRCDTGRIQFRVSGGAGEVRLRIGLPGAPENALVKTRVGQIFELGMVQSMVADEEGTVQVTALAPGAVEVSW